MDSGPDRMERIKARIGGTLKRRFFLRFHISLILVFTFCAGLATTRVLLWLGMKAMWLRYLAAMLVAYVAFLVGVRLWLAYVGAAQLPDAIVLVLLAVIGSAFRIIWIGPEILVEAAFEAMLAGGLVKSLHGGGTGGWVGRVLWETLLPFILVAGAAAAFAPIGQSAYPDARTLREVVRAAWLGEEAAGEALAPRETDPDIARADEDLNRLGAFDKLVKPDDRARVASALVRKGGLLARSKRHEEMEAAYDRAAGLVRPGDPPEMQHMAADAMRLKAYALGEAGKSEEALAAYSALQERIGKSGIAIAYGGFLSGDRTRATQALAQIPMKERNWILSSVIAIYADNRTLPIDAEFRVLGEQQLKAANG